LETKRHGRLQNTEVAAERLTFFLQDRPLHGWHVSTTPYKSEEEMPLWAGVRVNAFLVKTPKEMNVLAEALGSSFQP
jgi:hypothetical protein